MAQKHVVNPLNQPVGDTGKDPYVRPGSPWTFVLWALIVGIVVIVAVYAIVAGV